MSLLTKGGSSGGSNSKYNVNIDPTEGIITIGHSKALSVTVEGDANPTIVWKCSDERVATVDEGVVKALDFGTTTITATYKSSSGNEYSDKVDITVGMGSKDVVLTNVSLKNGDLFMPLGGKYPISLILTPSNAYVDKMEFKSDNTNVVTVDNLGEVVAVGTGETKISYSVNNTYTGSLNVYVDSSYNVSEIIETPQSITFDGQLLKIKVGGSAQLSYTVVPSSAARSKFTWISSDTSKVTVDDMGNVYGVQEGLSTITVKAINGQMAKIDVEVEKDIVEVTDININANDMTLVAGEKVDITPIVSPDNASNKALKYSSSNESVAMVAANDSGTSAKIIALSSGTAVITVKSTNDIEKSIIVTVTGQGSSGSSGNSSSGGSSNDTTIKVRSYDSDNKEVDNFSKYLDDVKNKPIETKSKFRVEIHSGVSYVMVGMSRPMDGQTCKPNDKHSSTFDTGLLEVGNIYELCITKHNSDGSEIPSTSTGNYSDGALRYYINTGYKGGSGSSTTVNCCVNGDYRSGIDKSYCSSLGGIVVSDASQCKGSNTPTPTPTPASSTQPIINCQNPKYTGSDVKVATCTNGVFIKVSGKSETTQVNTIYRTAIGSYPLVCKNKSTGEEVTKSCEIKSSSATPTAKPTSTPNITAPCCNKTTSKTLTTLSQCQQALGLGGDVVSGACPTPKPTATAKPTDQNFEVKAANLNIGSAIGRGRYLSVKVDSKNSSESFYKVLYCYTKVSKGSNNFCNLNFSSVTDVTTLGSYYYAGKEKVTYSYFIGSPINSKTFWFDIDGLDNVFDNNDTNTDVLFTFAVLRAPDDKASNTIKVRMRLAQKSPQVQWIRQFG